MKLNRREAIVGAVAAAVAPKLPVADLGNFVAYENPWLTYSYAYGPIYQIIYAQFEKRAEEAAEKQTAVLEETQK